MIINQIYRKILPGSAGKVIWWLAGMIVLNQILVPYDFKIFQYAVNGLLLIVIPLCALAIKFPFGREFQRIRGVPLIASIFFALWLVITLCIHRFQSAHFSEWGAYFSAVYLFWCGMAGLIAGAGPWPRIYLRLICVITAVAAILGILQYAGWETFMFSSLGNQNSDGIFANFSNPNQYASLLMVSVPFWIGMVGGIFCRLKKWRWLSLAGLTVVVVALGLTLSRGGIFGVFIGFLIVFVIYTAGRRMWKWLIPGSLIIVFLVTYGIYSSIRFYTEYFNRIIPSRAVAN